MLVMAEDYPRALAALDASPRCMPKSPVTFSCAPSFWIKSRDLKAGARKLSAISRDEPGQNPNQEFQAQAANQDFGKGDQQEVIRLCSYFAGVRRYRLQ